MWWFINCPLALGKLVNFCLFLSVMGHHHQLQTHTHTPLHQHSRHILSHFLCVWNLCPEIRLLLTSRTMDEEVTSSTVNKKRRRRTPFYGHHFQQQRRERWHHFSHHHRKEEQQRENYLSIGSNSRHLGYRRVIFTTAVIIMSFQFLILFSTSSLSFVIASSLPPPSTAASSSTLLPSSPSSSSSVASYLPSSAVSAALALTSSSFSPAAVASSPSNTPAVDYDDVKFDGKCISLFHFFLYIHRLSSFLCPWCDPCPFFSNFV